MNKIIILFYFIFIYGGIKAQRLNFFYYNSSNSPSAAFAISLVFEEQHNECWLSTLNGGVFRYTNGSFVSHSVNEEKQENNVSHLYKDSKAKIWYINRGISKLSYAEIGDFKAKQISSVKLWNNFYLDQRGLEIFYIKDTPFIIQLMYNSFNIYNLKTATLCCSVANTQINGISLCQGKIYVSRSQGIEVMNYSNGQVTYTSFLKLPNIEQVCYDGLSKQYWLMGNGRLYRYKSGLGIVSEAEYNEEVKEGPKKMVLCGDYLYLYSEYFIFRYNIKDRRMMSLTRENGLLDEGANAIVSDRENNVWFCQRAGLLKLPQMQIQSFSGYSLGFKEPDVTAYTQAGSLKIVAGNTRIALLDQQNKVAKLFEVPHYNKYNSNRVLDITATDASHIYYVFYHSFGVYDPGGSRVGTSEREGGYLSMVHRGSEIYMTKNGFLLKYDVRSERFMPLFEDLSCGILRKIIPINDSEFMLCGQRGAIRYHLKTKSKKYFLKDFSVYGYCETAKEKRPYFACYQGLYFIDNNKINKVEAIPDNVRVYNVKEAKDGLLWLGTSNGVYVLENEQKNHRIKRHISFENGLLGAEISRGAFYIDGEDHLWVGTNGGLNVISTGIKNSAYLPPLNVMMFVNNQLFKRGEKEIKYNDRNLQFSFEFNSFANEGLNTFSYMLEGSDKGWSAYSTQSRVNYPNLPPGSYVLKVRAKNAFGEESAIVSYFFFIKAPWWGTWWFIVLCSLALGFLLYLIFKYRIRKVKSKLLVAQNELELKNQIARAELKALRVQINPHFFGNTMQTIQMHVLKKEIPEAINKIERYSTFMRLLLELSEVENVSLITEAQMIKDYVELEKYRMGRGFVFEIRNLIVNSEKYLVPTMMIQPFVENALNYGLANKSDAHRELKVVFEIENDMIKCTIYDNGIGRKAHAEKFTRKERKSFGNRLVEARLKLLAQKTGTEARIEYDDFEDKGGFKVTLWLPLMLKK